MSDTVTRLSFPGREYVLVGTAHVSAASITEVTAVIHEEKPDRVGVEIDAGRYKSLSEPQNWEKLDVFQVIRQGRGFMLLANLTLSSFQKKIGSNLEVKPGQEMLAAVETATELGIPYSFIDRDVNVTLRRAWKKSSFWGKNKLLAILISSVFEKESVSEAEIENLKKKNELEHMMDGLAKELPTVKEVLIDERDQFLATSLFQSEGTKLVAIVGAGHVPGMTRWLEDLHSGKTVADTAAISQVPPPSRWSKFWPWLIPLAILALLGASLLLKGTAHFWDMLLTYVILTGGLAGVGALAALAHPLSILTAVVMAPLKPLRMFIGTGVLTALVEGYFKKPRVSDFENLTFDLSSFKGLYFNRITHLLLVLFLTSVGTEVGLILSLARLATG